MRPMTAETAALHSMTARLRPRFSPCETATMSQIPMSNEDRLIALSRFGYTEREAAFLCLAALHGGYFMRRQYGDFAGKEAGGIATSLIEKALAKEHASVSTYERNIH